MTADDWRKIAATSTTLPDVEWDIRFLNGEQTRGRVTHLPSGPPEGWGNDALFHIEPSGSTSEVGARRRIDQVIHCVPSGSDSEDTHELLDEADTDPEGLRQKLEEAKRDVEELGGWAAFKSGDWLLDLVRKSFSNYYRRATDEYFRKKYPGKDAEFIARKLISVAARNSSIVGALTGAAVTADEIVALVTGAEGGVGLPANIAIAALAISAESVLVVRLQMQLVAELARVHGVPLDPEDPEDILTILAFALGGSTAEAAGKAGMKVGGQAAGKAMKKVASKEVLKSIQAIGNKVGVTILQKQLIKYTVPLASVIIGGTWNYVSTRTIARIAGKHMAARMKERNEP